jgi:hypothetical protein
MEQLLELLHLTIDGLKQKNPNIDLYHKEKFHYYRQNK